MTILHQTIQDSDQRNFKPWFSSSTCVPNGAGKSLSSTSLGPQYPLSILSRHIQKEGSSSTILKLFVFSSLSLWSTFPIFCMLHWQTFYPIANFSAISILFYYFSCIFVIFCAPFKQTTVLQIYPYGLQNCEVTFWIFTILSTSCS